MTQIQVRKTRCDRPVSAGNGWPVDGHVHFHSIDRVGRSLDAAARHFSLATGRRGGLLGALLLTQANGEYVFEQLGTSGMVDGWRYSPVTGEPQSLLAHKGDTTIAIICGRQVRADGGLEVLALGTCKRFVDGTPFESTFAAVRDSDALAVLPWGFGKWLGHRGQQIQSMLGSVGPGVVSVGDNGSRLSLVDTPELIRTSAGKGFQVLPGTDPFPFGDDYSRVGSFGFLADLEPDPAAPWVTLKAWLTGPGRAPTVFGNTSGPVRFVFNQVGIQVYNRFFRNSQR